MPESVNPGLSFDRQAELYHQVRPRYPERLFDDLVERSGIPDNARLLEIGAGTGIATEPMARRGYHILALEPGAQLAAIAKRHLGRFDGVSIEPVTFEQWPLAPEPFDVVYSATAFHWLAPETRYRKSAAALKPGGCLAILEYRHVAGDDDAFFQAAQGCYQRFQPGARPRETLPAWNERPDLTGIEQSDAFDLVAVTQMRRHVTYDSAQYIRLMSTYSVNLVLDPENRERLFDCLATLMDTEYGGTVSKAYRFELILARRRE